MEVARGGAHVDLHHHHAAQADGDRGGALVGHPGVEHERAVGTALVGGDPLGHRLAARLLLALHEHSHVHRQLVLARERARHVQERQEVSLVVGGPAGVDAAVADVGLEGR